MANNVEELEMNIVGNLPTQGPKNEKILNSLKKSGDSVADSAAGPWTKAFGKLGDSTKDAAKKGLGPLGGIVEELPAGFGAVALGVGGAIVAVGALAYGTKKLIDSMKPLQDAQRVFQFKSATNGLAVLARIRQLGSDAGFGLDATTEAAQRLGQTFNNTEQAEKAFKTIADLKALVPTVGLDKLTDEFVELRAKASVGGSDMEKFKKILGSVAPTFDTLAKQSGLSVAEVQTQIKAGTFSAQSYADALGLAAREAAKTGKQGEAALTLTKADPSAQINRLTDSFTFLKEAFGTALLGPDGAAGALGGLADSIKAIATNPQVIAFVTGLGKALSTIAGIAIDLTKVYFTLQASALKPLLPVIDQLSALFARFGLTGSSLVPILTTIFQVGLLPLRVAITVVSAAFQVVIAAVNEVMNIFSSFNDLLGGIPAKMFDLGIAIVQGLVAGISSLASAPIDTLKKIGLDAIAGVKSVLGIASPSKAFAKVGQYTTQGFTQGISSGEADVSSAATSMANTALGAGTPTLPSNNSLNKGGGSTTNNITISPVINVGGSNASAGDISKTVVDAMITALKQAGLSGQFSTTA